METKPRTVVVVLGPGRSGTSLVMQVLKAFGLSVSDDLVEPRHHNPEGPMEDLEIASIYDSELLPLVGSNRLLPFPWEQANGNPEIASVQSKLKETLEKNVAKSPSIWGFKEPFTSSVLPLWFQVFNRAGVVPRFILCTRNPAAVVNSRKNSFGNEQSASELAWLSSTVSALWDSGADLFVLHYEDWFREALSVGQKLLHYTSLDAFFDGDLESTLASVIKGNLNRSGQTDYEIQNRYVSRLYDSLKGCRGTDFDSEALMMVVKDCRQAMNEFQGWYLHAQQANTKLFNAQNRIKQLNQEVGKVKILEKKTKNLELEKKRSEYLSTQLGYLQKTLDQLSATDAL